MTRRALYRLAAAAAVLLAAPPAGAHEGPPYPILVDREIAGVKLSVWADPDVGTGTFHLYVEPLDGGPELPERCEVRVLAMPVTGRLPERGYQAEPSRRSDRRHHYVAEVDFDSAEDWRTRFVLRSDLGRGEASTVVEVTPPGQGPLLDFVLYLFPFVAVGFLAVRALLKGRRVSRERPAGAGSPSSGTSG